MRLSHWVKNLLVLFAIFLLPELAWEPFGLLLVAFFCLGFVSSANYIINDIHDRRKDAKDPVKKNRPVAAGKLSPLSAGIFASVLLITSLAFGYWLSPVVCGLLFLLFALNQVYTFWVKKNIIAGVFFIPLNYVARFFCAVVLLRPLSWTYILMFFLVYFATLEYIAFVKEYNNGKDKKLILVQNITLGVFILLLALQAILFRSFKSWFTVACVLAVMFRVRYMFKSGKLKKHPFMNPVNIFVYDDFTAIPFIVYVGLITWGVNWYTLLIWFVILMLVHILFGKDKTRDSWLGRRCDGEVTLWFLFLSSFILTVSSRQTDYTSFTVAVCIISFLLIFDVYTWLISTGYKTYSDYYNKEKPPKRYLAGFRFLYYKLHH